MQADPLRREKADGRWRDMRTWLAQTRVPCACSGGAAVGPRCGSLRGGEPHARVHGRQRG
eukprot:110402-Chlamydomonas_euryale.AAC.2